MQDMMPQFLYFFVRRLFMRREDEGSKRKSSRSKHKHQEKQIKVVKDIEGGLSES